MTQTGDYSVNAQGLIAYAQMQEPETGIRILQLTFGMARVVAEELYYGNLVATCKGAEITELRQAD